MHIFFTLNNILQTNQLSSSTLRNLIMNDLFSDLIIAFDADSTIWSNQNK